jgi:hypothetical protein
MVQPARLSMILQYLFFGVFCQLLVQDPLVCTVKSCQVFEFFMRKYHDHILQYFWILKIWAKKLGFSFCSGPKKKMKLLLGNGDVLTLGCH